MHIQQKITRLLADTPCTVCKKAGCCPQFHEREWQVAHADIFRICKQLKTVGDSKPIQEVVIYENK